MIRTPLSPPPQRRLEADHWQQRWFERFFEVVEIRLALVAAALILVLVGFNVLRYFLEPHTGRYIGP